jgi:hypothetical protein
MGQKDYRKDYANKRMTLQMEFAARAQMVKIKQVLMVYMRDNNGVLPTLSPIDTLVKELGAYRISKRLFISPAGNALLAGNKNVAGKRQSSLPGASEKLLLWDPKAFSDGNYLVLDAALTDRKVSGGALAKMKKTSGL